MGFTDADGRPVDVPVPPPAGSHYPLIGALQGDAYHRNAFAQGTEQEARVLADILALSAGDRVIDLGCGNGRHVAALQARGIAAMGVDLAPDLLIGGVSGLVAARAECLPFADETFDAGFSVCQGGFGVSPEGDRDVLAEWFRVLRPGGRMALTAFSLAFAVRWMGPGDAVDLVSGVHHHVADVRDADGATHDVDLWTTAYTPAHLRLLLSHGGFRVLGMAGVEAGAYRTGHAPTIGDPELLVWGQRL